MGNVFKHIKHEHPLYVPPTMWFPNKSEEHSRYWTRILNARDNGSSNTLSSSSNSQRSKSQSIISFANSTKAKLSIKDQLNLITESVVLGFLPVSFASNRGLHYLVAGYNGGEYPYGLGDKAVKANIKLKYQEIIEDPKNEIPSLLPPQMSQYELDDVTDRDDKYKYCRVFGLQHDCWGSRAAKSFLGLMLQYMDTWKDVERWVLESVPLACQPFDVSHTSENILSEAEGILKLYGIPLEYCSATTQDTASNSFNAFDPVPVILQQPCAAHKFSLSLGHGIDDVPDANVMVEAVQSVMRRLKGCNSSKRKTILERACKDANIKVRRPVLKVATRWNSAEMMITRFLFLLPALQLIKEEDMPTSSDEQASWSQLLRIASNYAEVLEAILPVLTCVSQWTQVLSMNGQVTISLVPLAVAKIKEQITVLHNSAIQFRRGADRTLVEGIAESLLDQFNHYFLDAQLNMYCYNVAAFLDPRVFGTLSKDQKTAAIRDIKETLSSTNDSESNERPNKQARVLTEDEELVASLKGAESVISISAGGGRASSRAKSALTTTPSPVDLEIAEYIQYIINSPPTKDPLLVWPRLVLRGLRILPKIARRLFVISACSSDVERLFSKAGYWVSPRKNQLSSEMLNELLVLNAFYTYKESFLPRDLRNALRSDKLKKFVKFHSETPVLEFPDSVDSDSDSSSEEE